MTLVTSLEVSLAGGSLALGERSIERLNVSFKGRTTVTVQHLLENVTTTWDIEKLPPRPVMP